MGNKFNLIAVMPNWAEPVLCSILQFVDNIFTDQCDPVKIRNDEGTVMFHNYANGHRTDRQ